MGDMRRSGCGVGCAWSGAEGRARLAMRARVVVYGTRGASSGTRLVGSCLAECGVARDAGRSAAQARLPRSGTALVTRAGPCVAPRRGRAPLSPRSSDGRYSDSSTILHVGFFRSWLARGGNFLALGPASKLAGCPKVASL